VELRRLRVGEAAVSLAFERDGGVTGFSLLERERPIRVTMTARAPLGEPVPAASRRAHDR